MNWQPLYRYYGLAFGITWGVGGLGLLAGAFHPAFAFSPSNPLCYVAGYGPTIAGLITVGRREGRAGSAPAGAGGPDPGGIALVFRRDRGIPSRRPGGREARSPRHPRGPSACDRLLYPLPLTLVTDTGPLREQFAWRGFALPFLLRRRPPLAAALILGVVWAFWHLPTFFIPTLSQSRPSFPVFLLNSVALSVIMTWLNLRSGGDLLLIILVHLMANYSRREPRGSFQRRDRRGGRVCGFNRSRWGTEGGEPPAGWARRGR